MFLNKCNRCLPSLNFSIYDDPHLFIIMHYLQRGLDAPDANDLSVGDVAARHGELEVAAHQQLRRDVLQLQLGQFRQLKLRERKKCKLGMQATCPVAATFPVSILCYHSSSTGLFIRSEKNFCCVVVPNIVYLYSRLILKRKS